MHPAPKLNPDAIKVILATDCGSTTTKAILIQYVDGHYRQTHRGGFAAGHDPSCRSF
ncbi:MAG: hypothetical protein HRU76_07950 [Phycisphaeraceae bacterium]|nr:hypothetical protein [Phycisphaerales bacterium]QOJ17514.1 MAG: hypothetical protein HRU76_07950 [Phycisphaeraceae bacterium]